MFRSSKYTLTETRFSVVFKMVWLKIVDIRAAEFNDGKVEYVVVAS